MSALLKACQEKDYPCEPVVVISNRPDAAGLKIAQEANVPTHVVDHKEFSNRESFEEQLNKKLKNAGAHILCNAGFMRILTEQFTHQWHDRHLNIHPSLLPRFPGTHVHERVLESGVKITGCTVHYVRAAVDSGPIIGQCTTPVYPDDTVEILAERVLQLEHKLYPHILRKVAEGNAQANIDFASITEQYVRFLGSENTVTTLAERTLQTENELHPLVLRQITEEHPQESLVSAHTIEQCARFLGSENTFTAFAEKILQTEKSYLRVLRQAAEESAQSDPDTSSVIEQYTISPDTENTFTAFAEKILQTENQPYLRAPRQITEKYAQENSDASSVIEQYITLLDSEDAFEVLAGRMFQLEHGLHPHALTAEGYMEVTSASEFLVKSIEGNPTFLTEKMLKIKQNNNSDFWRPSAEKHKYVDNNINWLFGKHSAALKKDFLQRDASV